MARAAHLADVTVPMLFVQGTRDALAELPLLDPIVSRLPGTELVRIEDGDHSFHAQAKSSRTDAEVMEEFLDAAAHWIRGAIR